MLEEKHISPFLRRTLTSPATMECPSINCLWHHYELLPVLCSFPAMAPLILLIATIYPILHHIHSDINKAHQMEHELIFVHGRPGAFPNHNTIRFGSFFFIHIANSIKFIISCLILIHKFTNATHKPTCLFLKAAANTHKFHHSNCNFFFSCKHI